MNDTPIEEVARQLRLAFELGDMELFGALLAPNVTWGPPGDPSPPCQTKSQVLAWYQRGADSGTRAKVQEIKIVGNRLLVGLVVSGTPQAKEMGGRTPRWQVLTIEDSLIVDIVGFMRRSEAIEWISVGRTIQRD